MTFEEKIAAFFAAYFNAFAPNDADALSEIWDTVALFPSHTGNVAIERSTFRDHCVTLMEFYRQQGVIWPEVELLSTTELLPDVAQTRITYVQPAILGLPVVDHRFQNPKPPASSTVFAPAFAYFFTPMICFT